MEGNRRLVMLPKVDGRDDYGGVSYDYAWDAEVPKVFKNVAQRQVVFLFLTTLRDAWWISDKFSSDTAIQTAYTDFAGIRLFIICCTHDETIKDLINKGYQYITISNFGGSPYWFKYQVEKVEQVAPLTQDDPIIKVDFLDLTSTNLPKDGSVSTVIQDENDVNADAYKVVPLDISLNTTPTDALKAIFGYRMDRGGREVFNDSTLAGEWQTRFEVRWDPDINEDVILRDDDNVFWDIAAINEVPGMPRHSKLWLYCNRRQNVSNG